MNIALNALPASLSALNSPSVSGGNGAFAEAIGDAIGQVESAQESAKSAAAALLIGGQGDVHSVALAAQRATLSLELFQQVRNKFVSAYQEIMRMPM
jgi:flagellar hook-basal body complex protein FliE